MFTKTLAALAVAATAALPLAAQAGSGADQLARSLGVEPGVYSLTQLSTIAGYASENSGIARQQIAFILANPEGSGSVTRGVNFGNSAAAGSVFPQDFGTENPNRLND